MESFPPHEITEINVPFGNQPVIGYSISFPELNNLQEINTEEVKSKTENMAYLVNKTGTQLEMDFEIEDED